MTKLKDLIDELVTANRILATEGIVDAFGHVSVRHPKDDTLYLLTPALTFTSVVSQTIPAEISLGVIGSTVACSLIILGVCVLAASARTA